MKLVGFILLLISTTSSLYGQNSAVLKQKKEAITKEIEALKQARTKTGKNKKVSLKQISILDAQIALREEKIAIINSEVKILDSKITSNRHEVKSLEVSFDQLKMQYASMVKAIYRTRSINDQLAFVFAANNFNEAYKRLRYIQQISRSRKQKAKEIQVAQDNINQQLVILDKNKREKNHLLVDEVDEKKSLGKDKAQQTQVLEKLTKQEQNLAKQLAQKQHEAKQLNHAIQAAIHKEIQAARLAEAKAKAARLAKQKADAEALRLAEAKKNKLKSAITSESAEKYKIASKSITKPKDENTSILSVSPEAAKLSDSFLGNKGRLPGPVKGIITERFGTHVYKNITINNPGITIKTQESAPVHAIFDGQVSNVIFLVNSYTVIIRHGEYFSIYSKLKNAAVKAGQKVNTKHFLGNVYTNQTDDTTEMGFQIWKGATPINPSHWVSR